VVVHRIERPAKTSLSFAVGKHQPPKLHRATKNAYDVIGFLVGAVAFGRDYSSVRPDRLREDVSTRAPTDSGSDPSARATILVIVLALVVLFDHGSSRAGRANPLSPVTSVSAFLMHESVIANFRLQVERPASGISICHLKGISFPPLQVKARGPR
jgi:hypothetical protein